MLGFSSMFEALKR